MLSAVALLTLANAAQPFPYMEELRQKERAVNEAVQPSPKRPFAMQMLAFTQSDVGESMLSAETYNSAYPRTQWTPEESTANAERARKILGEYQSREAVAAIVSAARDRQIVILNEAHHVSRHRAFATLLAIELRKLGFEYLAVETLDDRTPEPVAGLQQRRYPLVGDGYYSKEPLFGDFLRRSLAAGYRPVAYEFSAYVGDVTKLSPVERQIQREAGQAQNIIDHVLVRNPRARILVYVGYGHAHKGLSDVGGQKIGLMAEQLRVKSGIDPLCIDQAFNSWPKLVERDKPVVDAVLKKFSGDAFVMAKRDGAGYWNDGSVDIHVWHRPVTLRQGREHWLAMGGYRKPKAIPSELLPREGRRLVQAFVAGESADAVPVDQVLVTAGETPPVFMLPKGKYRFAWQDYPQSFSGFFG